MPNQMINLTQENARLVKPLTERRELSNWINQKIQETFQNKEVLMMQKEKLIESAQKIENQIRLLEEWETKENDYEKKKAQDELPKYEREWWNQTLNLLEDEPTFFEGRRNLYNNEFGKSLNKGQFAEKIEEIRKKLKKTDKILQK